MVLVGLSVPPLKNFYCVYYMIPRPKCKASFHEKKRFVKSVKNQKTPSVNFVSRVKRKPPALAGSLMTTSVQTLCLFVGIVFFEERNQLQDEIQNDLDIVQALIHDATSFVFLADPLCEPHEINFHAVYYTPYFSFCQQKIQKMLKNRLEKKTAGHPAVSGYA